ncbi:MAG: iron ABC transporter permease [Flavobacteriales bacterium]|nr:iron ABC transporter permease [Flavobacteriales bacterium]
MPKKHRVFYLLLLLSAAGLFLLDIFIGSVHIPFQEVVRVLVGGQSQKETWDIIILQSRLPQSLAAVLCGAALSVSGLKMQTLFKNPLAGPYILGISSGGALGVALFIMGAGALGFSMGDLSLNSSLGIALSSILGSVSILSLLIVVIRRLNDIMTVLILGVMIGSVITALIGLIQFFSYEADLKTFVMWTMGDLSAVTGNQLLILFPVVVFGLIASFMLSKPLNSYLLGETYATSIGVNINRSRMLIIIITSILTGSVTAFCGPIGFIGIVIPHMARFLAKTYDHRILIPLSILLGMNVLLLADILSQLPQLNFNLPINSITSLIGIPVIIWIIFKNKRMASIN